MITEKNIHDNYCLIAKAATDPGSALAGPNHSNVDNDIWFDTAAHAMKYYDATAAEHMASRIEIETITVTDTKVIDYGDCGKLFVLAITGAKTITLPAPAAAYKGVHMKFYLTTDEALTIESATANTVIAFNNITTADSITFGQTGEQIGSGVEAICDGSKWLMLPLVWEAVTVTVNTA